MVIVLLFTTFIMYDALTPAPREKIVVDEPIVPRKVHLILEKYTEFRSYGAPPAWFVTFDYFFKTNITDRLEVSYTTYNSKRVGDIYYEL